MSNRVGQLGESAGATLARPSRIVGSGDHQVEILRAVRRVVVHLVVESEDHVAVRDVLAQERRVGEKVEHDAPARRKRVAAAREWYCHDSGDAVRVRAGTVSVWARIAGPSTPSERIRGSLRWG